MIAGAFMDRQRESLFQRGNSLIGADRSLQRENFSLLKHIGNYDKKWLRHNGFSSANQNMRAPKPLNFPVFFPVSSE